MMRRSYVLFLLAVFAVFVLTLFFNNFVEAEKHDFDRMQQEWTREEHHLMDELKQNMAEMKRMLSENTNAISKSMRVPEEHLYPSTSELEEAGLDDQTIRIVQNLMLKKTRNGGSLLKRLQGQVAQNPLSRSKYEEQQGRQPPLNFNPTATGPLTKPPEMASTPGQTARDALKHSGVIDSPYANEQQAATIDIGLNIANGFNDDARDSEIALKIEIRTDNGDLEKMEEVRAEMLHAWKAYEQYAWGMDVVKPLSHRGEDEQYKMGITLLDSLDTLWIMGLKDKFKKAVEWVRDSCRFTHQEVSVFETTIRALGGLLAAYHLSGEPILLSKAEELAKKMEPAFNTPTGFPKSTVRLSDGSAWCPQWSHNSASFSEVTSLYLEWNYLSQATSNPRYKNLVEKIMDTMINMEKINGLYAQWVNVDTARFTSGDITLGSRVDSAYEYLEKAWRASGRKRKDILEEYLDRMDSVEEHLIRKSTPNGLTYIQQCTFGMNKCHGQFDHLVCFAPAMLALGALEAENPKRDRHMELAGGIMETCWQSYERMSTGLAPEIIKFDRGEDFFVDTRDKHNLLRPETVESLFVMWRVTHNQKYRDQAYSIFKSFRKWAKVDGAGYSSLSDVTVQSLQERSFRDHTESFFFAETLKYLYLIFADDSLMPLDKYVFNTEAHAFPI